MGLQSAFKWKTKFSLHRGENSRCAKQIQPREKVHPPPSWSYLKSTHWREMVRASVWKVANLSRGGKCSRGRNGRRKCQEKFVKNSFWQYGPSPFSKPAHNSLQISRCIQSSLVDFGRMNCPKHKIKISPNMRLKTPISEKPGNNAWWRNALPRCQLCDKQFRQQMWPSCLRANFGDTLPHPASFHPLLLTWCHYAVDRYNPVDSVWLPSCQVVPPTSAAAFFSACNADHCTTKHVLATQVPQKLQ